MYKANWIILAILIVLLTLATGKMIERNGDAKYARGFDDGAMSIISKLLDGERVYYTRVNEAGDTEEFNIDPFVQELEWTEHEKEDSKCAACHKYSTKYLEKGGESK